MWIFFNFFNFFFHPSGTDLKLISHYFFENKLVSHYYFCRINDDELHRFYNAANGDFSCLLSSIKKTIRWRETYKILSVQELDMWSRLVFWHGCDVNLRPCLVIRLGLACSTLAYHDRPRFAQAVGMSYSIRAIIIDRDINAIIINKKES